MVWEFLKFYNQKDQWVIRVVFDGEVPANKAAALTLKNDIMLGAYILSAPLSRWSGYKVDRGSSTTPLIAIWTNSSATN